MKEFKGTKGRWENVGGVVFVGENIIADVFDGITEEHKPMDNDVIKANSNLIASAPELLDSCINLLTLLTAFIEREDGNSTDFYEDVVNAEKAINKALGL